MKRALWILGLLGCGGSAREPARVEPSHVEPPKRTVAVAMVVDQLGAWVLDMHAARWAGAQLGDPACLGFCRLMRTGTYHTRMEYAHAITDTAPGHASLFTGQTPRQHGIHQNEKVLIDPSSPRGARAVPIVHDANARLIDARGVTDVVGPSLSQLRVPTVADQIRRAYPDACIVSVSLKDRAALFGGGRKPTLTAFYEPAREGFVTTSALGGALPSVAHVQSTPSDRVWTPLDPTWLAAHAPTADAQPGEGSYHGLGATFPHPLAGNPGDGTPNAAAALRMTPFGDDLVHTVATQSLALCKDSSTVLVAVSFSSHDYILHGYGAHSWEAWDETLRLDHHLATWLDELDAAFGKDAYGVVLSADHGSIPLPELPREKRAWCNESADNPWDLPCEPGVRLAAWDLHQRLEARATALLGGEGPWIAAVTDPRVVFTPRAKALSADKRRALVDALRATLLATGGVEEVVDLRTLPAECGAEPLGVVRAEIAAAVCHSEPPTPEGQLAGDLFVVVRRGSFFDPGYSVGRGESHGSPWLYDRSVPLLVRPPASMASDLERRGTVHTAPIGFRAYARTLRSWFGLEME